MRDRIVGTGPWVWNASRGLTLRRDGTLSAAQGGTAMVVGGWAVLAAGKWSEELVLEIDGERWRAWLRDWSFVAWPCGGGRGEEVFARMEGDMCGDTAAWRAAVGAAGGGRSSELSLHPWRWGSAENADFKFIDDGKLQTTWGSGNWGMVPGRPDFAWAYFVGMMHLLRPGG